MAKPVKINATVDRDELVNRLPDILASVTMLADLVPEWSSLEAEELEQDIYQQISTLIDCEVQSHTD